MVYILYNTIECDIFIPWILCDCQVDSIKWIAKTRNIYEIVLDGSSQDETEIN